MSISEHDRRVLQELENDLRTDSQESSLSVVGRRTARLCGVVAAVVIGLLVMFVGLRLNSATGTCVAVAGFAVLVASARLGAKTVGPWLKSRMRSIRDSPKS